VTAVLLWSYILYIEGKHTQNLVNENNYTLKRNDLIPPTSSYFLSDSQQILILIETNYLQSANMIRIYILQTNKSVLPVWLLLDKSQYLTYW